MSVDDENSIASKHAEDDGDEAYEARQRAKAKAITEKACFCPRCGGDPSFEINSWGVVVTCSDCHDGAPDAGPQMSVSAETLALAVDRWNEMRDEPVECRRCTECTGSEHHWIDNHDANEEGDATHACKHCDALGDECSLCDGEGGRVSPDGYVLATCPRCKGEGVVLR